MVGGPAGRIDDTARRRRVVGVGVIIGVVVVVIDVVAPVVVSQRGVLHASWCVKSDFGFESKGAVEVVRLAGSASEKV
jgi:hypothetical protein